ncbi:hypothetical protein ACSSS7_002373 [Eimeria intestinalis]
MRITVCPGFSYRPSYGGPVRLLVARSRCRYYGQDEGFPMGLLRGAPSGLFRCFLVMLNSSLFVRTGVRTPRAVLPPASATRRISIYSFQQPNVQEAIARIEELHMRGMYGSTGPWRRLLQNVNANFQAAENMGESAILSLVSAVSASLRFTACPYPEAHRLAANILQTLAANPTATAAPAANCSDGTRLRLLLLLLPLVATHPEKGILCALRTKAFEPLQGPCVHALQAAASAAKNEFQAAAATKAGSAVGAAAAATGAAAGAAAATQDASLLAAVSADPFGVLHLLLASIEAREPPEEHLPLLKALEDAARVLLPLVEEEKATVAAFVCARLLLLKRLASRTNDHRERRQEDHGHLPDTYASAITNNSSSTNSSSISNSSSSSSINSSSRSNTKSSTSASVNLEVLTLRCLLRAPLSTASAAQIEEASAALSVLKRTIASEGRKEPFMLTAERGEAAREEAHDHTADTQAAATLSLLSAAETHISQAAAGRAASLEPKEVLRVVATVSNRTAVRHVQQQQQQHQHVL